METERSNGSTPAPGDETVMHSQDITSEALSSPEIGVKNMSVHVPTRPKYVQAFVLKTSPSPLATQKASNAWGSQETSTKAVKQIRSSPRKNFQKIRNEYLTSSESDVSSSDSSEGSGSESDDTMYCMCGRPNTDDMIGCDGKNCKYEWFHFKCVGINPKRVPRGKWFCKFCNIKKNGVDGNWNSKLQQVCREIMSKTLTVQSASQAYGFSVEVISEQLHSKPILSTQEEQRLVEMAVNMCKQGHWPIVKESVVNSVKVLLDVEEKMGIKRFHPFPNNQPQNDWWEAFCKRHPRIMILKQEYEETLPKAFPNQFLSSNDEKKAKSKSGDLKCLSVQETISKLCRSSPRDSKWLKEKALEISRKHKKHKQKGKQEVSDLIGKKRPLIIGKGRGTAEKSEPNALECLEAIIIKKQRNLFEKRFKSGDESESDVVYAAWRALRCLYGNSEENEKDDHRKSHVPPVEGDIPPWSPCPNGPFYVTGESSKASVSLLIGRPGKKRLKKMLSRITSMKAKRKRLYLEPWRFRLGNRKALMKPWKFEVKKRNRRKSYITRRFESGL